MATVQLKPGHPTGTYRRGGRVWTSEPSDVRRRDITDEVRNDPWLICRDTDGNRIPTDAEIEADALQASTSMDPDLKAAAKAEADAEAARIQEEIDARNKAIAEAEASGPQRPSEQGATGVASDQAGSTEGGDADTDNKPSGKKGR